VTAPPLGATLAPIHESESLPPRGEARRPLEPERLEARRRAHGMLGLAGAIVLFAGDMLLYGSWGAGRPFVRRLPEIAAGMSTARLFAGGALGPIGALLMIAGFRHVAANVREGWPRAARLMFVGFAVLMAGAGAFHALWTPYLLTLRLAAAEPDALEPLRAALRSYMTVTYAVAAVPGYVACGVLLVAVLSGRTRYPRWTALLNPGLLTAGSGLTLWIPAPLGAVFRGGYLSLAMALFFAVSLATTWRLRAVATPR